MSEKTGRKLLERYNPANLEQKWQERWEADALYKTQDGDERPKYYILDFYPYPSGDGLSVGHCRNYVPTDLLSRYYRMKGYNVLHPMGWDAFGLPAENAAIKQKTNPALLIEKFAANYKRQMRLIGTSYDWSREINSSHPIYYRWTQWIFLQLYNSWYDSRVDKAQPIAALEAELAEHGTAKLNLTLSEKGMTAEEWQNLSASQRQDFLRQFRLAYRGEATVNWDPVDKTVIANEEVDAEGRAWRSGALVERKVLKQWFFRITAYAERLSRDLDTVDWPASIITMQRNWVGRSEGAEVSFKTEQGREIIVFTTRPDTLWGATFMVLAPEHPLVAEVTTNEQRETVEAYVAATKASRAKKVVEEEREKTGVFTGGYALNPVNKQKIPIWIADYVLMGYGTGAIMAVPAHDKRDFDFALKFGLPIIPVIARPDDYARSRIAPNIYRSGLLDALKVGGFTFEDRDGELLITLKGSQAKKYASLVQFFLKSGHTEVVGSGWLVIFPDTTILFSSIEADGFIQKKLKTEHSSYMSYLASIPFYNEIIYHAEYGSPINSGPINGLPGNEAVSKTIDWLEAQKIGKRRLNYKMRDWLISRQRYWGTPIPIVYTEDGLENPLNAADLPLTLPNVESFEPTATGESPLALIEDWVNVSLPDGQKGSRETDTMGTFACSSWYYMRFADPRNEQTFAEKQKLAYWLPVDMYVGGAEHAVMHLLYARFWTKVLYDLDFVSFIEPFQKLRNQGLILAEDGRKMSKSFGNVITPDEMVKDYGADALRGYECFISDFELAVPWSTQGVAGIQRWLDRVWRITLAPEQDQGEEIAFTEADLIRLTHQTIMRVEKLILDFKFNSMIAALMTFTNALYRARDAGLAHSSAWETAIEVLLRLIAPVVPHIAEEIWSRLGKPYSIHQQTWPVADPALAAEDQLEIVLQVNGKVRDKITVAVDIDDLTLQNLALDNERIRSFIGPKTIRKVIVVSGKLVNIVV